jgi:predicted ester cyclase
VRLVEGYVPNAPEGENGVSAEENNAIARRSWEAVSHGNLDAQAEAYATDCVIHGAEKLRQFVSIFHTAFPDLSVTVEDEIAEGNKVVTRWRAHGTRQGELMGIPRPAIGWM